MQSNWICALISTFLHMVIIQCTFTHWTKASWEKESWVEVSQRTLGGREWWTYLPHCVQEGWLWLCLLTVYMEAQGKRKWKRIGNVSASLFIEASIYLLFSSGVTSTQSQGSQSIIKYYFGSLRNLHHGNSSKIQESNHGKFVSVSAQEVGPVSSCFPKQIASY